MDGIKVTVENAPNRTDIHLVKIFGYIDTTTSGELERVLQGLLRDQHFKIIMDLSQVDYISSAGWGIFISEIKNIRTRGGDLKLANMSESVNEVYELLEFSTILAAAPSINDAIKLFGEGGGAAIPVAPAPAAKPQPRPMATAPGAQPMPVRPAAMPASAAPIRPAAPAMPNRPAAPAMPPRPATPAMPPRPATPAMPPRPATPAMPPQPNPAMPASATASSASAAVRGTAPSANVPLSLIDRIKAVIRVNPNLGAWAIKDELNRRRGSLPKVSWGQVRMELKYHKLDNKTARINLSKPNV